MRSHSKPRVALIAAVMLLGALAVGVTWWSVGGNNPLSSGDAATARDRPPRVIGSVNGELILESAIDTQLALQPLNELGTRTRAEILQYVIDDYILATGAEASGVLVSEDEVTQAIEAGIVRPLQDPNFPQELRDIFNQMLESADTTADKATKSPHVRTSYRKWLLRNRLVAESGRTREDLLAEFRPQADVVIIDAELQVELNQLNSQP